MEQVSLLNRAVSLKRRRAQRQAYLLMGFAGVLFLMAVSVCWTAIGRAQGRHSLTTQEQDLIDLTNAARARENLPPLHVDPQLATVVRAYAQRKAHNPAMERPGEDVLRQELEAAGYRFGLLYLGLHGYETLNVASIFNALLEDEGTASQIRSEDYQDIGIAIVQGADQRYYMALFIASKQ